MRGLKFGLGLLAAVLLHLLGLQLWPQFALAFDLFLVVVVFNALNGDTLSGLLGGVVAGLVADAVSGGLFGLHGMVDTIIGYGTAYAAQRLVFQRSSGVLLIYLLASAAQQAMLMAVALLLLPAPDFPEVRWLLARAATTALLGVVLHIARSHWKGRFDRWRRTQGSKIRFRG
jgi:rod shape-determining protein MreD